MQLMIYRISMYLTCLCLLLMAVGCGKTTRSPIVAVSGTIGFEDGKKLPAGTKVVFSPVLGGAGAAMAETDADGNFALEHVSGARGAEVGAYVVELRSPSGMEQEFYASVPSSYTDGGMLSANVPENGGSIELVLRNNRKRR